MSDWLLIVLLIIGAFIYLIIRDLRIIFTLIGFIIGVKQSSFLNGILMGAVGFVIAMLVRVIVLRIFAILLFKSNINTYSLGKKIHIFFGLSGMVYVCETIRKKDQGYARTVEKAWDGIYTTF